MEALEAFDESRFVVLWWNKRRTHFQVCADEQVAQALFAAECNIQCKCPERLPKCIHCYYSFDQKEYERRRELHTLVAMA